MSNHYLHDYQLLVLNGSCSVRIKQLELIRLNSLIVINVLHIIMHKVVCLHIYIYNYEQGR